VRIRADRLQKEAAPLLRGARREAGSAGDRPLADHGPRSPNAPAGTARRRTFVDGLYREIDDETWQKLTETFF